MVSPTPRTLGLTCKALKLASNARCFANRALTSLYLGNFEQCLEVAEGPWVFFHHGIWPWDFHGIDLTGFYETFMGFSWDLMGFSWRWITFFLWDLMGFVGGSYFTRGELVGLGMEVHHRAGQNLGLGRNLDSYIFRIFSRFYKHVTMIWYPILI